MVLFFDGLDETLATMIAANRQTRRRLGVLFGTVRKKFHVKYKWDKSVHFHINQILNVNKILQEYEILVLILYLNTNVDLEL